MELVEEINSEGTMIVPSEDFEVYKFTSERTINECYRSLTHNFLVDFEAQLRDLISPLFKDFKYKILAVTDESKNNLKIKKVIILLSDKKIIDFVKDSLTQFDFKIECDILVNVPEKEKCTLFKDAGRFWCDQVHNYLMCEYNFKGLTKLNVAGHAGMLESFNFSASGKGTTDFIIEGLNMISQYILSNKAMYYANYDEIYNILEAYFKS